MSPVEYHMSHYRNPIELCPVPNAILPFLQMGGKIIWCSSCGMVKLKTKCKNRALAKALLVTADQEVTPTIFDDKLSVLYAIYKQQLGQDKEFSQLTKDLTEMPLSVNATITYSQNNQVLAISRTVHCVHYTVNKTLKQCRS